MKPPSKSKEIKQLIKPPELPSKSDLIAALQAGQMVLLSNGWAKGTLFETTIEDGKVRTSYCMLGALSASGVKAPIPSRLSEICLSLTDGEGLSYVNDHRCSSKEDALKFMDKMIKYIEERE